jgi:hypothetical protein
MQEYGGPLPPHASGDRTEERELRLVGVQVGCVLGKAGENISQIRKARAPYACTRSPASRAQLGRALACRGALGGCARGCQRLGMHLGA